MSFRADLADMAASIDDVLGEDATWSGVAGQVRVHFEEDDGVADWGAGRSALRTRRMTVHRSQVPEPATGDLVTLAETSEALVVTEDTPVLDRDGYWLCSVSPTP